MIAFKIESWKAIAPGLDKEEDWTRWLLAPYLVDELYGKDSCKQIPPMLRRRLSALGKSAVEAILALGLADEPIPSVFSSRHGDTGLTLSLLENMGKNELMSPKKFSLAVHNAVAGLYTMLCKNTANVTAISAMDGLVVSSLLESIGQLQTTEKVLCVIYDAPLPKVYQPFSSSIPFPYAISLVLSRSQGELYSLEQTKTTPSDMSSDDETLMFLRLLTGLCSGVQVECNGVTWSIKKVAGVG